MAQTIAMQQGTGTVTSGSTTTLFTQSGGIATRVIFNFISFYCSANVSSPNLMVQHVSAGGGTGLIGYLKTDAGGTNALQLMPAAGGTSPAQYVGNSASVVPTMTFPISSESNYMGSVTPSTFNIRTPTSANMGFLPSNYWIGPGDAVRLGWTDGGGRSITVAWSMTTITES